ncbi:MAG TPA: DICT sensory domain-containing protein [Nocardioides sp.]|nr:DICT sensory domain-containing protein [Nocardioides sp.]
MTIGIGELARRTGLTQQVVRIWESRFGFPVPARTEGGRRRYAEADVDRVQRVLALKDSGVRLAQAVDRVRAEETSGPQSVYAALRERHPQVESRVLRRDVLVAISQAIEDEAMSRASRPVVFGAFQRESFYRHASPRWNEIARTAACCVVFADFDVPSARARSPVEIPLAADAPLLREWAVVVVAPSLSVALAAWEIPPQPGRPQGRREFESIFTFDPAAVRTAAQVCLGVARAAGTVPQPLLATMSESLATEPTTTHGVDSLVLRAFDYLQRLAPHVDLPGGP